MMKTIMTIIISDTSHTHIVTRHVIVTRHEGEGAPARHVFVTKHMGGGGGLGGTPARHI